MSNKQAVVRVTEDQAQHSGFALNQLIKWAARCYALGAQNMKAEDAEAADTVANLIASGTGRIECSIDFTGGTAQFILHIDHAGEEAQEMTLFTQAFDPTATTH